MNIYVGHSSSINFREDLYVPIRESNLNDDHDILLPHEGSDELFDSKSFFEDECDPFIAEVSEASIGLGIELGWADEKDVPIICVCREDSDPSSSIKAVTGELVRYRNSTELGKVLEEVLSENF